MLKRNRLLAVAAVITALPANAAQPPVAGGAAIAAQIKADVALMIEGINSKDIDKATKFDAPDLVSMESGRIPSVGAKADYDGLSMVFRYVPSWHLSMLDETVDVAASGDMAVYRSTYREDSLHDGVPFTHDGNYLAGFKHDPDGMWRVHWSVVSWQSPSHKK